MTQHNIKIKVLRTMDELKQMQQVEKAVWQMDPIPLHHTFTSMQNGGILLGAFDAAEMIGFLYSFPGVDRGKTHLCSHMLGILPDYQKDGIGAEMKLRQAELAQEAGFSMITWTFDPLESRNAYLNLHKLGATGAVYHENYYGQMDDQLNQGLPTDRIQIKWDLQKTKSTQTYDLDRGRILLDADALGTPVLNTFLGQMDFERSKTFFAAVPKNFQSIKQNQFELAKQWRMKTRDVFRHLFNEGFTASDLLRREADAISYYVFTK